MIMKDFIIDVVNEHISIEKKINEMLKDANLDSSTREALARRIRFEIEQWIYSVELEQA